MSDFQSIETAPLDHPVMVRGKATAKAVWNPYMGQWTYATDDPDYCTPLNFVAKEWRELSEAEREGVSFEPPSAPDVPRD